MGFPKESEMASDKLLTLTDQNFEAEVLKSQTPVLVDFWAVWCGPCRQIAPSVESIADTYAGQLRVGKMDTDKNPKVPTEYDVRSIPTLLLFHGGKVVGNLIGAAPKGKLEQFVKDQLAKIGKASA
jgi:thioredoxin 1